MLRRTKNSTLIGSRSNGKLIVQRALGHAEKSVRLLCAQTNEQAKLPASTASFTRQI